MLIGFVGAPNKGKSTLFSAATLVDVPIADYPFTTIEPNRGITYVRAPCPHTELGVPCNPKNSRCDAGVRLIPMAALDVAGLVPEAHLGKGLGNQFLDDLRTADALVQVVDASGRTDAEWKPAERFDPAEEVMFLEEEIAHWIEGIIRRGWSRLKGADMATLEALLSGLKITRAQIEKAAAECRLTTEKINWSDADILAFAHAVRKISKPIIIAANKIDLPAAWENYEKLKATFPERAVLPCYAEGELALRHAQRNGIVHYVPGDADFVIIEGKANEKQRAALEKIRAVMRRVGGTGVQQIINKAVFDVLGLVVVYPVEDENRFTNHFGNVLPDAHLVPRGTTALEFAARIHTDLAKNFICAVNARTKMRVGKDYVLQNGDVIKIVAGR